MFLSRISLLTRMLFRRSVALAVGVCLVATSAVAASLESAEMGLPGKTAGVSIASGQPAVGWRFEVRVPFQVEHIGGHLISFDQQSIYGAIVAIDSITALPQGLPFNQDELVASATFVPPSPSDEILIPLPATLAPGAYALLFGTNNLEVTGIGALPNYPSEQPDIPPTTIDSYITYGIPRPDAPYEWRERLGSHMRMIVRGTTVGLTADFDIDGDADGADFLLWQRGTSVGSLSDWQTSFGNTIATAATVAVPEPSALALLVLGLPCLVLCQTLILRLNRTR